MSERTQYMGQRVELRQQRQRVALDCEALRDRLRLALPLAEEVSAIDREVVVNAAMALHDRLGELQGIDRKLAILNRELGD